MSPDILPYTVGKTLSQILHELDQRIEALETQVFEKK